MATKVIYRKTPERYNEVSPPPEDGKRVRFDSRPVDARFVMAAELELEVVSAATDNVEEVDVVVVRCLVGEVLCEVVLEILPLEETELEETELEATELEEAELEETELDITAPETWGASSFDPHISARAVSLTL
jgi:hypothetical protein